MNYNRIKRSRSYNKTNQIHQFLQSIFRIKLYVFRKVPLSIIRSFSLYTEMVYIIQVCWQLASRIRTELLFRCDPAPKLSANLYDIYHCCVCSEKTPDD